MTELLPPADLDQLRRQATELLRAAHSGDTAATARIHAASDRLNLAAAHWARAREHGFSSWAKLTTEVQRRQILDRADTRALRELLKAQPELAIEPITGWCDHPRGAAPLNYVAMMRYDTTRGAWRDVPGTGALAEELLRAGAPVDGAPGAAETPLMTAASYGNAEVAKVLIEAGASLTATAMPDAGGVPGGTALRHAAVFAMTDVADVLVAAGASDLVHAAATGSVTGLLSPATPQADLIAALRIAAEHGHLEVIDQLLAAGTPVDGIDRDGSTALHEAAYSGRSDSVSHLLGHGADPNRHDNRFNSTPLGWCRHRLEEVGPGQGHEEVAARLAPLTIDAE